MTELNESPDQPESASLLMPNSKFINTALATAFADDPPQPPQNTDLGIYALIYNPFNNNPPRPGHKTIVDLVSPCGALFYEILYRNIVGKILINHPSFVVHTTELSQDSITRLCIIQGLTAFLIEKICQDLNENKPEIEFSENSSDFTKVATYGHIISSNASVELYGSQKPSYPPFTALQRRLQLSGTIDSTIIQDAAELGGYFIAVLIDRTKKFGVKENELIEFILNNPPTEIQALIAPEIYAQSILL